MKLSPTWLIAVKKIFMVTAIIMIVSTLMQKPHHTHRVLHHKAKLVWNHVYLSVTAYVVNKTERDKCDVYWQARTATGTKPQVGTAAVDPRQFPFGTRFLVPGYGPAVARDTGGAITFGHLDLVMPTCKAAFDWGRKQLLVAYREN